MARGWCALHYERWRKTGTTALPDRPSATERFWAKVQKGSDDECWEWTGSSAQAGYGTFWSGTQPTVAHRFSYELHKGPIGDGLTIDHLCFNPPCVNPRHLEAVTFAENNLRGNSAAAVNARKTHCPQGHPYDEANTWHYRNRRYCMACLTPS